MEFISLLLMPVAILIIVYACFVYYMRSKFIEKKQVHRNLFTPLLQGVTKGRCEM